MHCFFSNQSGLNVKKILNINFVFKNVKYTVTFLDKNINFVQNKEEVLR